MINLFSEFRVKFVIGVHLLLFKQHLQKLHFHQYYVLVSSNTILLHMLKAQ